MEDEKLWVYIGKGNFVDGVPARDLTSHDWARLDEDARVAVERSGLYRRAPRQVQVEQPASPQEKGTGAKSASSEKGEGKGVTEHG